MQDPSFYSQINNNQAQVQLNLTQLQTQPQFPENEHLKCPRCDSVNTKFCYYNNYNLSQPRHFCKNCKRYWTKGGALRNIPVGGGTRKRSGGASDETAAKRPATTTVVPEKESNDEKGKSSETLGLVGGEHFEGQFGNFSSLIGEGQFGNFGEVGQGQEVDPNVGIGDGFLNIGESGDGNNNVSNNAWPDLSIYTPGSTFQ